MNFFRANPFGESGFAPWPAYKPLQKRGYLFLRGNRYVLDIRCDVWRVNPSLTKHIGFAEAGHTG